MLKINPVSRITIYIPGYLLACAANNHFEWGLCEKYSAAFGGETKFLTNTVFIDFAKQNQ